MKALQSIDMQAVVTVELKERPRFGIFAEAVACMPQLPGIKRSELFLLVDLGVLAILDIGAGTFQCEGQLSPASFILSESCHLTGGFALCFWFAGSEHSGDWVFTVGGYHAAYKRPAHYPSPPRLGISWQYDEHISITGQAYFAITPQVAMGGCVLQALFHLGKLSAHFDAHADMMINYQPFQFTTSIGVSVGVAYEMNLLLCTGHIAVELGAELYLHGPPLAGTVHVNFYVFGFDISFGPSYSPKPKLNLQQFWALLQQKSGSDTTVPEDHVFAATDGLLPWKRDSPNAPWIVRPGRFRFQIHSRAAISLVTCFGEPENKDPSNRTKAISNNVNSIEQPLLVYSKPMQIRRGQSNFQSKMTVELSSSRTDVNGKTVEEKQIFDMEHIFKEMPKALWDACKYSLRPRC